MKKIYYLGNPLVRVDKKPIEIVPYLITALSNIEFIHSDPTENIDLANKTLFVLDTVLGITEVTIFKDLNSFVKSPMYSVHDYDLLSDAAILLKLGKIKKIVIIGVPPKGKIITLTRDVMRIINKITHKN